jgi:CRP-like cAMP-binding protein
VQQKASIEVKVFKPQELAKPVTTAGSAAEDLVSMKHILRETDIFRDLSDAQLNRVADLAERLSAPAGQVLERADELGDRLFVIVSGDAQLYTHSAVGEVTVRIASPGESFPLAALVGSGMLITSGKALTDMELLVIERSSLLELCWADLEIGVRVYSAAAEVFANRYRRTLEHLSLNAGKVLRGADFLEKLLEPRVLS